SAINAPTEARCGKELIRPLPPTALDIFFGEPATPRPPPTPSPCGSNRAATVDSSAATGAAPPTPHVCRLRPSIHKYRCATGSNHVQIFPVPGTRRSAPPHRDHDSPAGRAIAAPPSNPRMESSFSTDSSDRAMLASSNLAVFPYSCPDPPRSIEPIGSPNGPAPSPVPAL